MLSSHKLSMLVHLGLNILLRRKYLMALKHIGFCGKDMEEKKSQTRKCISMSVFVPILMLLLLIS